MKKFLELLQQQDGGYCALQLAIVGGFSLFWITWVIISIKTHTIAECPSGILALLTAMLGAKVWKDYVDFHAPKQE